MTTRKGIYPQQLPDSPPNFVMLHCAVCGETYSAHRGDYFLHPADEPLTCCDGFELFIVTRKTVLDHDRGLEYLQ